MAGKSREELIQQDIQDLHKLGYAQQLFREMGGFSNFAISFSIISILTGAILLFGYGLGLAGPVINTFGWPLVSFFVICIAASMAELASAYPTAGGLYFWAFRLADRRWAWVTAWFNMIGQVTITAGIDIAAAIYITGAINRIFGTTIDTNLATNTPGMVGMMILIMIPQVLINIFGIKWTARLNNFSVYWHIGGVIVMALLLLLFGKYAQPFDFLFHSVVTTPPATATFFIGPTEVQSIMMQLPGMTGLYTGGAVAIAFVIGLLQAQWTYTGYDASAHVAEETVMARLNSAWGVFLSVAVSFVVGYVMLLILTLRIPNGVDGTADIAATVANSPSVLYIVYENLADNVVFAHIIAIIIGVAMWLCGLSSITSMSRMWFAFARDGGLPGHSLIRQIHPRWRTPVWSIIITCILAVLLTIYAALYSVVVAISTTALYLAYGIPIFLNLRNKLRKKGEYTSPETAPWSLKSWGVIINIIAIVWIVFITILFSIPPNELAGWSIIVLAIGMFAYWQLDVKKRFTGPKPTAEADLRKIESEFFSGDGPEKAKSE
ncbi:MAG: amino acid permease [Anaerolineae bacterium]